MTVDHCCKDDHASNEYGKPIFEFDDVIPNATTTLLHTGNKKKNNISLNRWKSRESKLDDDVVVIANATTALLHTG